MHPTAPSSNCFVIITVVHKSHDSLITQLKEAASKVQVGGLYYHYKNPEKTYKVLKLAITEADDSICVIYEAQYDKELIFVRPLASWLDKVEAENKVTDRFTFVKQENHI